MNSRIAAALAVLVSSLMFASCDHGESKQGGSPDAGLATPELQGTWMLSSISGTRIELPDPGGPRLLVFEDGDAQASAGCRLARVTITSDGTAIEMQLSDVGWLRGCPNGVKDPTQGGFFRALRAIDTLVVSETKLTLSADGADLQFAAEPPG